MLIMNRTRSDPENLGVPVGSKTWETLPGEVPMDATASAT